MGMGVAEAKQAKESRVIGAVLLLESNGDKTDWSTAILGSQTGSPKRQKKGHWHLGFMGRAGYTTGHETRGSSRKGEKKRTNKLSMKDVHEILSSTDRIIGEMWIGIQSR